MNTFRNDPRFRNFRGQGMAVAVLDTGTDLDHPAFGPDRNGDGRADRIVAALDFTGSRSGADDRDGHGTNVASIVGASSQAVGMAPGVNLISLKVLDDDGNGSFGDMERALRWVIQNRQRYNIVAVNMSIQNFQNYQTPQRRELTDELATLKRAGVVSVASAGNDYEDDQRQGVSYPSADPHIMGVGSVWDSDRGRQAARDGSGFEITGRDRIVRTSQRHVQMTPIFAPGALIDGAGVDGGRSQYNGTSQAAPHIAGIVPLA